MSEPTNISKIWIINLILVLAVLFVYGGLNWFDTKDPEAAEVKAPVKPNASFSEQLKNFFSFSGTKSSKNSNDENAEYGFAEDGTKLKLDTQDYEDSGGIFSVTPEDEQRLITIESDLERASNQLVLAVKLRDANPYSDDLKEAYLMAEERVFELQDERDALQKKINESKTSNSDGL